MDKRAVLDELHNMEADPVLRASARIMITRIEDNAVMGTIIIFLLEVAEKGGFQ